MLWVIYWCPEEGMTQRAEKLQLKKHGHIMPKNMVISCNGYL